MQDKIDLLKAHVIAKCKDPSFIHHPRFVEYHLSLVERIANELCSLYPAANKDIVNILVRVHDYGKICNFDEQYTTTLSEWRKLLEHYSFPADIVDTIMEYAELIDRKNLIEIAQAPIEVQILSSADGCSHVVGPFMHLYRWENADRDFKDLMQSNRAKAIKDRTRKICLPEARKAFEQRFNYLHEQMGELPEKFF